MEKEIFHFVFCRFRRAPGRSTGHANETKHDVPSELYMCIEREKVDFKSREVNCLKECTLALSAPVRTPGV